MLQGLQASNKGWCSCYWSVQQKVHLRASATWQGQYFSSWSFNSGSAGTQKWAPMLKATPLRLKGSWTLDSFPRGQSIINFPVQVATTQTRESCTAEVKQIFDRQCLKLHMLQQHAKGMSVLGKFVPSKNCAHYCFFPWDTQIFPFQNSGQLTCNKLPQIWMLAMLAANLKLFSNLFSQASLKEWRPCVSCRTCRATLQSKQVQSKQARMPQFHLLALAGRKPLPVVGLQEQLPLVLSAAHHRCTASDFHWLLVSYPLCFQEGPTQAVSAPCSVPSLFSQSGHKPKFYSSPGGAPQMFDDASFPT